jgi:hypothetical protein
MVYRTHLKENFNYFTSAWQLKKTIITETMDTVWLLKKLTWLSIHRDVVGAGSTLQDVNITLQRNAALGWP